MMVLLERSSPRFKVLVVLAKTPRSITLEWGPLVGEIMGTRKKGEQSDLIQAL
jgi:hypothetical protein